MTSKIKGKPQESEVRTAQSKMKYDTSGVHQERTAAVHTEERFRTGTGQITPPLTLATPPGEDIWRQINGQLSDEGWDRMQSKRSAIVKPADLGKYSKNNVSRFQESYNCSWPNLPSIWEGGIGRS